jgi:hypothetical protein
MPTATRNLPEQEVVVTWPPGTRHYAIDDGTWVLVEVDDEGPTEAMIAYTEQVSQETGELIPRPSDFLPRPTIVLPASSRGFATSLDVLDSFTPGTSYADALQGMGYTVVDEEE